MKRRDFLKILGIGAGAIALEQAIPLGRVYSFPATIVPAGSIALEPGFALRFIRAWDPVGVWDPHLHIYSGRMMHRIDVGDPKVWRAEIPPQIAADAAYVIRNPTARPLVVPLPNVDRGALEMLKMYRAENPEKEIFGVHYVVESPPLS